MCGRSSSTLTQGTATQPVNIAFGFPGGCGDSSGRSYCPPSPARLFLPAVLLVPWLSSLSSPVRLSLLLAFPRKLDPPAPPCPRSRRSVPPPPALRGAAVQECARGHSRLFSARTGDTPPLLLGNGARPGPARAAHPGTGGSVQPRARGTAVATCPPSVSLSSLFPLFALVSIPLR